MPETNGNDIPVSQPVKTQSERTEAKFFEDIDEIITEAASNASGENYDKITYLDPDSLLNGCISAKDYIKSKFKTTGQPYKNIAKTRFPLPSRLRRK